MILSVTEGKTFVTSKASMLLSDECGILIPGSRHSCRSLIIRFLQQKIRVDMMRVRVVLGVCLSERCISPYRNTLSGNVNAQDLQ